MTNREEEIMKALSICNTNLQTEFKEAALYYNAGMLRKANDIICEKILTLCEEVGIKTIGISSHERSCENEVIKSKTCLKLSHVGFSLFAIKDYPHDVPTPILDKMIRVNDKERLYILDLEMDPYLIYRLPLQIYRTHPSRSDIIDLGVILAQWGEE